MKKLSPFDIGMIIAFVVVALLGGGGWWYLSGQLAATQQDVAAASADFQKYSSREVYLPTARNEKILQDNIAAMKAQLDPLVRLQLQAPGNRLAEMKEQSPVAWKHDLDEEVSRLNQAAKVHGVSVPANFYYGFSRYLSRNPGDPETVVLSKQLLGVEQITDALIQAPVKSIGEVRRTYEEDPVSSTASAGRSEGPGGDIDVLAGRSLAAPGNVYTAYPFQILFNTDAEGLRRVFAALQKSPYVFVVREMMVKNSKMESPQQSDLQSMAGAPPRGGIGMARTSILDIPGAVAATRSTKGPQFLFGNETVEVQMRLDMIEWNGVATPPSATRNAPGNRPGLPHGNG